MRARHFATALVVSYLSLGCGSDPKAESDDGSPSSSIPDYTRSPCYGTSRTTSVYDTATHGTREVTATCRAEGDQTLLYVADEIWDVAPRPGAPAIGQSEVNAFMVGYEREGRRTSYRPDLGVLPTDELVFGALPGDLPDGKLPIVVVDSGGAGEGYLCQWCGDIELHLDGPLLGSLHSDKAFSIAAHETVHAIHRGQDADETVWVDETLAQAAMTLNGFFTDEDWLDDFLRDPNVDWGPSTDNPLDYHYGAGLLFGTYLWEQGGRDLLHTITREPLDDWAGLDAALAATGSDRDAFGLFLDMGLSTFLDDPATPYSFDAFELADQVLPYSVRSGTRISGVLEPYGLLYVVFEADARSVTVEAGENVVAWLVLDGQPTEVLAVEPEEPFAFASPPRVLMLSARVSSPFAVAVE
jgi:hypothetical protein